MTDKKDGSSSHYDPKRKTGRFSWVKKIMQSRTTSPSRKGSSSYKGSKNKPTELPVRSTPIETSIDSNSAETAQSNGRPIAQVPSKTSNNQDMTATTKSLSSSLEPTSIAHESIFTKPDNTSTVPVISMSTMSIRSSTFSEHSEQSTSPTMASEHPTLFTNASTVGIPPSSIFDRRERNNHPSRSINSHLYITSNNSSSNTLATGDSSGNTPLPSTSS